MSACDLQVHAKSWCTSIMLDASHQFPWRKGAFDAVVSDPPYGAREQIHNPGTDPSVSDAQGLGLTVPYAFRLPSLHEYSGCCMHCAPVLSSLCTRCPVDLQGKICIGNISSCDRTVVLELRAKGSPCRVLHLLIVNAALGVLCLVLLCVRCANSAASCKCRTDLFVSLPGSILDPNLSPGAGRLAHYMYSACLSSVTRC